MRKLIMWNVMTLDGYFEGEKPWDLHFHEIVWGKELEEFSKEQLTSEGMLIFGKNTYIGMAEYWQKAKDSNEETETATLMNSIPKLVCSRSLEKPAWNNTTIIRDAVSEIPKLKQEVGNGDMFVFGSSILSESLMKADLFDEYRLCIAPVLLGSGKRLFKEGLRNQKLKLLDTRILETGGIICRHLVIKP